MNRRNNKVVFKQDHDEKIDVPQEPPMMPELAPASAPAPAPTPEVASKKKRVVKPKGERKANTWVSHVRNISKAEGISYKQAMGKAKESYKKE